MTGVHFRCSRQTQQDHLAAPVFDAFDQRPELGADEFAEHGFFSVSADDFAACAVRLLGDEDLWRRQHEAALASQRRWGWAEAAVEFERLLP